MRLDNPLSRHAKEPLTMSHSEQSEAESRGPEGSSSGNLLAHWQNRLLQAVSAWPEEIHSKSTRSHPRSTSSLALRALRSQRFDSLLSLFVGRSEWLSVNAFVLIYLGESAFRREACEQEEATLARYAGFFPRAGTVRLRATSRVTISPKSRATDTSSPEGAFCPDGWYVYSFFSSIADGSC